jgi:hypothetical protein
LKRTLFLILLIVIALFAAYVLVEMNWSYSSGKRAGWVQKFSRKGWLCKTWEGEMAMVTMPGTIPEKFAFTVWDDRVVAQIDQTIGRRVELDYLQKKGLPSTCFGDTEYWVTGVHVLPDVPPIPGAFPAPVPSPPPASPAQ